MSNGIFWGGIGNGLAQGLGAIGQMINQNKQLALQRQQKEEDRQNRLTDYGTELGMRHAQDLQDQQASDLQKQQNQTSDTPIISNLFQGGQNQDVVDRTMPTPDNTLNDPKFNQQFQQYSPSDIAQQTSQLKGYTPEQKLSLMERLLKPKTEKHYDPNQPVVYNKNKETGDMTPTNEPNPFYVQPTDWREVTDNKKGIKLWQKFDKNTGQPILDNQGSPIQTTMRFTPTKEGDAGIGNSGNNGFNYKSDKAAWDQADKFTNETHTDTQQTENYSKLNEKESPNYDHQEKASRFQIRQTNQIREQEIYDHLTPSAKKWVDENYYNAAKQTLKKNGIEPTDENLQKYQENNQSTQQEAITNKLKHDYINGNVTHLDANFLRSWGYYKFRYLPPPKKADNGNE